MQEHDREQFAGLGEDKSNIIYMGEGGVTEWRSKGGSDGNKEEVKGDTTIGIYWRSWSVSRSVVPQVYVAHDSCEEGLESVKEDRKLK